MKIITDFDGTLTQIEHEYEFEKSFLMPKLHELCDHDEALFNDIWSEVDQEVARFPEKYGWFDHGRITAFSDEDLFMQLASRMMLLDHWIETGGHRVSQIAPKLQSMHKTMIGLTEDAHQQMNQIPIGDANAPESETMDVIRKLLDRGDEIIIVSNSPAYRIIHKLAHFGIAVADEAVEPDARFRVRGNAMKFALDEDENRVQFGNRTVEMNRAGYKKVILDEKPDVVIGDVFSLDLALPYYLASQGEDLRGLTLCLRVRDYTSPWALQCVENPPFQSHAKLKLLRSFTELL